MSRLDDALITKIFSIVLKENRPFSFLDFTPTFECERIEYPIAYGTVRNKFSILKKQHKIEVCYRSKQTFYSLVVPNPENIVKIAR
jgi:hypothetical protein